MSSKKFNPNEIYEIVGSFYGSKRPGHRTTATGSGSTLPPTMAQRSPLTPNTTPSFSGINIGHCSSLRGWQRNVISNLQRGRDCYILADPGAGKTLPFVCYWAEQILGMNPRLNNNPERNLQHNIHRLFERPEDIPKMLILVPTRQLTVNTYNDFIETFASITVQGLLFRMSRSHISGHIYNQNPNFGSPTDRRRSFEQLREQYQYYRLIAAQVMSRNISDRTVRNEANRLNQLIDEKFRLFRQYQNSTENPNFEEDNRTHLANQLNNLDSIINESLAKVLNGYIVNYLVAYTNGADTKGNLNESPVIISVYESISKLRNSVFSNTQLLVIDEAHFLQGIVDENNERTFNLANTVYRTIGKIPRQARVIFLSGTQSQSAAQAFSEFSERCLRRRLHIENVRTGNTSNISIHAADWLEDQNSLINLIIKPKSSNQLIVLFSKNQINTIRDAVLKATGSVSAKQVERGYYQKAELSSNADDFGLPQQSNITKNPYLTPEMVTQISKIPGAEGIQATDDDPENKLLESVLAGFGYIYRNSSEESNKAALQNMQIVSKLFSEGKIHTLLATDAVGIGVNINVKDLYIPSIEKYDGVSQKQIANAPLSQLLNRTGRAKFNYSNIYTPAKYVNTITKILSIGSEGFSGRDDVITMSDWGKLGCNSLLRWYWRATR